MGLGLRGVTCCRSLEEALQAMGVRLLSEDEARDEHDAEFLMMDADGP
jgi:hypothetical protein